MFGYVRPVQGELLVRELELYRAVYCGMCKYGGKHVSVWTRFFLNYDFVLLALLRLSLTNEKAEVKRVRCPYKLQKKNMLVADEVYRYVCSCFSVLSYLNNEDDIADSHGKKRLAALLLRPLFRRMKNRAGDQALLSFTTERLSELAALEREKCADFDLPADCFAQITQRIAAQGMDGVSFEIAAQCGYHLGRFIYLIDALDDLQDDEASNSYNPFLCRFGSAEKAMEQLDTIVQTITDSMNAFSSVFGLKTERTPFDRIIFNICELGSREAVERVISAKEKKK